MYVHHICVHKFRTRLTVQDDNPSCGVVSIFPESTYGLSHQRTFQKKELRAVGEEVERI